MDQQEFKAQLEKVAREVENGLKAELVSDQTEIAIELSEAMRAGSLDGGKRIRPFLVHASAGLFSPDRQLVNDAALAIELIHCYSLVHDDLPQMDNDELRRGRPTVWKAHGEATAILAGDALQTLAFEVLTRHAVPANALIKTELASGLARAAGRAGMVSGQMRDLAAEVACEPARFADVVVIHAQKTGALISFAAEAGAIIGGGDHHAREALRLYGEKLGLAFQLKDDLLDIEGSARDLGKTPGKDEASGKATLIAALGHEKSLKFLDNLRDGALYALELFGEKAALLRQLVHYVCERKY